MKKCLLIIAALLMIFGLTQAAAAAVVDMEDIPYPVMKDYRVNPFEGLGLNDQQLAKMRQINQQTFNQTRDLRIKMMDAKHELRQLQLQNPPDQAQIDAKVKEISDLHEQMSNIIRHSREECRSILTPEQREQVDRKFKAPKQGCFRGSPGPGQAR